MARKRSSISGAGSNRFSRRLRIRAEEFEAGSAEIVKAAAAGALESAILASPVDTSALVSNWIMTIGGPNREFIGAHVPGRKGSTRSQSSATALANGLGVIQQWEVGKSEDLFMTNVTPYLTYNGNETFSSLAETARNAIRGRKLFR